MAPQLRTRRALPAVVDENAVAYRYLPPLQVYVHRIHLEKRVAASPNVYRLGSSLKSLLECTYTGFFRITQSPSMYSTLRSHSTANPLWVGVYVHPSDTFNCPRNTSVVYEHYPRHVRGACTLPKTRLWCTYTARNTFVVYVHCSKHVRGVRTLPKARLWHMYTALLGERTSRPLLLCSKGVFHPSL